MGNFVDEYMKALPRIRRQMRNAQASKPARDLPRTRSRMRSIDAAIEGARARKRGRRRRR